MASLPWRRRPQGLRAARAAPRLPAMSNTAILVLAAGASSRMGGADKLLQLVAGRPLLARVVARAAATGRAVLVALPGAGHARAAALADTGARPVRVPDAAEGMAASIRAGVADLPTGCGGVMILPADMPDLTTADITAMLDAFDAAPSPRPILRATDAQGTPGHPVVFPRDMFGALSGLRGDAGARVVIAAHRDRLRLLPLPGGHATTDLDTPADWARWRARGAE